METGLTFEIARDAGPARALRRRVFVEEMGIAPCVEADLHDAACEHAVLRDAARPDLGAVATTRIAEGTAYASREFDLSRLHAAGRPIAELGRTCVHPDYRGGLAALVLFRSVAERLARRGVKFLVGTASLPVADPQRHMAALRALRAAALAPEALRPVARGARAVAVSGAAPPGALRDLPPLLKSYLRAGAWVGDGAWVDGAFGCVDVCLVLDMDRLRLPGPTRRARANVPA